MARKAVGPINTSRGSGPAVPASAAATAHRPSKVYDPDDGESGLSAVHRVEYVDTLRRDSVGVDDHTADVEVVDAAETGDGAAPDGETLDQAIARIRATRKPVGAYSQKLALPSRSGYHRHWFNDTAGRIEEAAANGWAHVKGSDGKPIKRCVGTGRDRGALFAYAMEIPLVFWQEDQDSKNRAAGDVMDNLKRAPVRAPVGGTTQADKGKFYDPTESSEGIIQIGTHR